VILADDFGAVKQRFFTRLPGGEPVAVARASAATRDHRAARRVTLDVIASA
jgi:hypothetical protein